MKRTSPNERAEKPLHRERLLDLKTGKTLNSASNLLDLEGASQPLPNETTNKPRKNPGGEQHQTE
jgi:hypothetical protein